MKKTVTKRRATCRRGPAIALALGWSAMAIACGAPAEEAPPAAAGEARPAAADSGMAMHDKKGGHYKIHDWWPNMLDLRILNQNAPMTNPMGADFDYTAEFSKLDFARPIGFLTTMRTELETRETTVPKLPIVTKLTPMETE